MAIFASFVHCLPNILHTWPHMTAFRWYDFQWPWAYFKVTGLFHIKFLKNGVWYGKSYYRLLIGNHTLAFDWCHFWWSWSTFEGHFSLGCHFRVHFSNPWHAFASHGLPAIAELLVKVNCQLPLLREEFSLSKLAFHSDLRRRAASRRALPHTSSLLLSRSLCWVVYNHVRFN